MTVTTTTDQRECLAVFFAANINPVNIQPKPPHHTCDAIVELDDNVWLIITNARGSFTMHVLEDASAKEAWQFFDGLKPGGVRDCNHRAVMVNAEAPERN